MTAPILVLLVPPEGDPNKLLGDKSSAEWRCGARPPVIHRYPMPGTKPLWTHNPHPARGTTGNNFGIYPDASALVLVLEGQVLRESCGMAAKGLPVEACTGFDAVYQAVLEAIREGETLRLRTLCEHHGLGTPVFGREDAT